MVDAKAQESGREVAVVLLTPKRGAAVEGGGEGVGVCTGDELNEDGPVEKRASARDGP